MTDINTDKFMTPAEAAQILGISVATLRKYSLIVEHSTNDSGYFERNKQNNRLYTQKNLDDFNKMVELGHGPKMTLQSAAKQVYPIKSEEKSPEADQTSVTSHSSSEINSMEVTIKELRANIDQQDRVIQNLSKKILKLQEQNAELSKNAGADKPLSEADEKDKKYQEYLEKVRQAKAKKEQAAEKDSGFKSNIDNGFNESEGEDSQLKTLVNMQVNDDSKKPHWWNKFLK